MHNKVILTIDNTKKYVGYNSVHPEFLSTLCNLFYEGIYNRTLADTTNFGISGLSTSPAFSLSSNINNSSMLLNSVSSVGIYAFTNQNDASLAYGNKLSNLIGYPLSLTSNNANTYSLSSKDYFSFIVYQKYTYSPTADITFQGMNIGSFSIKNNYSSTSGLYSYLPFASINMLELTGKPYEIIYPTQSIDIQWNIDLSNMVNNSVNSMHGNIHDVFKYNLKNILSSSSSTSSFSTTSFKISNIIAFDSPGLAYINSGTAGINSFILTSSTTSVELNNYIVTYNNTYTNNTNNFQRIGSLLLIGSGDINNNFPIAWIDAKDIWGEPIRIINPNEVVQFTWKLDLTPQ